MREGDEPRAETMGGGHVIKNKLDPLFHQRECPEFEYDALLLI